MKEDIGYVTRFCKSGMSKLKGERHAKCTFIGDK
jgi:hypothetical protein